MLTGLVKTCIANTHTTNLTVNPLVEMFTLLIDNIYIQIGSAIYLQTIGDVSIECTEIKTIQYGRGMWLSE